MGHTPATRSRTVTPSHPSPLGWFSLPKNPVNAPKTRHSARRGTVRVLLGNHRGDEQKTRQV